MKEREKGTWRIQKAGGNITKTLAVEISCIFLSAKQKTFTEHLGRLKNSSGRCVAMVDARWLIFCRLNLLQLIIWFSTILPEIAVKLSHHLSFCLLRLKCGQCCRSSRHQTFSLASARTYFLYKINCLEHSTENSFHDLGKSYLALLSQVFICYKISVLLLLLVFSPLSGKYFKYLILPFSRYKGANNFIQIARNEIERGIH